MKHFKLYLLCVLLAAPLVYTLAQSHHKPDALATLLQQEEDARDTRQCILGIRDGIRYTEVVTCTPAALAAMSKIEDRYYREPGHYPWLTTTTHQ